MGAARIGRIAAPSRVGKLAKAIDSDPGYVSRLLEATSNELLIDQRPRGPVKRIGWKPVCHQMSASFSLLRSKKTSKWVASAGPNQLLKDLASSGTRGRAVTGSVGGSGQGVPATR